MSRPHLLATALAAALLVGLAPGRPAPAADDVDTAPADLRLEWLVAGRPAAGEAGPIRGREGETVTVPYRLRNVGGADAFAVILEARTALGRSGAPERLQPGPAAGAKTDRTLRVAVATGMRELCIDARLQTVEAGGGGDPNRDDNRICRRIEIDDHDHDRDHDDSRRMG